MRILSSLLVLALAAPAANAADRPWVKFSFSLPAGDPTFNAFDPTPLEYYRTRHDIRHGHQEGALIGYETQMSSAHLAPQPGRSWGARLRVQTWDPWKETQSPVALDLSWVKEHRSVTQVWASRTLSIGTYHERCPPREGRSPGWCVDFGGGQSTYDNQYNEHRLSLHVFRAGLAYDLLHSSKHFSLEPGIGLEWSVARHERSTSRTRITPNGRHGTREVPEDTRATNWPNSNEQTGYASLSADVYPLGKRRFVALGASTRYLLTSGDWVIRDGTLLGNYEIPIRSHRWSTSFHATLAF